MTEAHIPHAMDAEEVKALQMEAEQDLRWLASDRSVNFWRLPEEMAAIHEMQTLRKISGSYQRRHGYPPGGLAFTHRGPVAGAYSINPEGLAHMVAAHISGLYGAIPEQMDFEIANEMLALLEAKLKQ